MEGSYFYFFAWIGWIVTTFLLKKDGLRLSVSIFLLLVVIGSQIQLSIFSVSLSGSALVIMGISCFGVAHYSVWMKLYTVVCTLIIAMIYTIFHVIELYDPVWIVIDRTWMLGGILVYASVLLYRNRTLRIFGFYIGMLQGELFLTFMYKAMNVSYAIGSFLFLNTASVSTMLFVLLYSVVHVFPYSRPFKKKQAKEG